MEKVNTAKEMKELLSKFNNGIKNVSIEYGIICVSVGSLKAAKSVIFDLSLSKAFSSIQAYANSNNKGFTVQAVPRA